MPVRLACGEYAAEIVPNAGGRLASLRWRDVDLVVPWQGEGFDEHAWPKAGAFPMAPFANRIPGAAFKFNGFEVQPESDASGKVLHGLSHRRSWRVASESPQNVRLEFSHLGTYSSWPWTFAVSQDVRLQEDGLVVDLALTNRSLEDMPASLGWHPYHPQQPGPCEPADFQAKALHVVDESGRAEPRGVSKQGDVGAPGTAAYRGWDGALRLPMPGGGELRVVCEGADVLVLHRPASPARYLCTEPVTALPGWVGSSEDSVLAPGKTLHLRWQCSYLPASSYNA